MAFCAAAPGIARVKISALSHQEWPSSLTPEHVMRINHHEDAAAAGEKRALLIKDLGGAGQTASAFANLAGLNAQRLMERNWSNILNGHARGGGGLIAQFVQLTHGVVENGGDDSAVAVSGWSGVARAQLEAAGVVLSGRVSVKLQMHAIGVVRAASEAIVLFDGIVSGH